MLHFGISLHKRKYALNLLRDEYAPISQTPSLPPLETLVKENAYTDETHTKYSLEWCISYRKLCIENFDLNMRYFSLLDRKSFNIAVENFLLENNDFEEVEYLIDYSGVEGYYMMVLDTYKQVYIGKTDDIKRRIMQHWTKVKPLDRALCPMYAVDKSCLSIDAFRALDTTRIYACKKKITEGEERRLVGSFPNAYLCNRIGGDITNLIEALLSMNRRSLK